MMRIDKMTPAAALLLILTACGGGHDGSSSSDGQTTKWLGSSVVGSSETGRPVVGSSTLPDDHSATDSAASTPAQPATGDTNNATAQPATGDTTTAQPAADDTNDTNNTTAPPATGDTTTTQPAAGDTGTTTAQPAAGDTDTTTQTALGTPTETQPSTGNTDTASTPAANTENAVVITRNSVRGDALAYALRNEVALQDGQQEGSRSAHVRQSRLNMRGFVEKPDMPAGTVERKVAPGDGTLDGKYTLTASLALEDSPVPEYPHPSVQTYQISLSDIGPLSADVATSATNATVLELGSKARASASFPATQDKAARTYDVSLTAEEGPVRISRNEMVDYTKNLITWSIDAGTPAQEDVSGGLLITVYRGDSMQEFEVCIKALLFEEHRNESCTMWEVPANWAPGKHLIYKGQHVYNFLRVYRSGGGGDVDWTNVDTEWRSEPGTTNAATAQAVAAAQ